MPKITYLSEIISALHDLGGMASLKEICSHIESKNILPNIHTNMNWQRNVSSVIQRHCSQTKSYAGGNDLFYSVFGLGQGFWGLVSEKSRLSATMLSPVEERQISEIQNDSKISITQKEMLIKARIGQGIFRESLLKKYKRCMFTGIDDPKLLIASHIKPWRVADNAERLSINNGLILSPLYDKLFDSGLISFDSDLNVIISSKLSSYCRFHIPFNVDKSILMPPSEELFKNLEYHRNNIFLP